MPPAQRKIYLQIKPPQESQEQITDRLARATAVLLRIAERVDARNSEGTKPPASPNAEEEDLPEE